MSIYYKRTAIEDIQRAASYIRSTFQNEKVARAIDGKSIVKVILVRNKLVNLIVK